MTYLVVENGIITNTIVAEKEFADSIGAKEYYEGAAIGDEYNPPEPEGPTPSELREEAYNTQKIISWDGEMITVTEASQLWQYYSVEKDTEKTELLSQLVIEAKTKIREQYPDEDTSVTDESQVTQEQQEQTVEETVVE